jgi:hypothetical protein
MRTILTSIAALTAFSLCAQVPSYVPTDGLVGWWPFNGNANDESGNGNNGAVNGATLTEDRFGNSNSSYNFDGVNDLVEIQDNNSLDFDNSYSISVWQIFNSTSSSAQYFINKGCSPTPAYRIYYEGTSAESYTADCFTPIRSYVSGPSNNSEWVCIVVTYDGLSLKLFINGILYSSSNQSGSIINSNSNLLFGCSMNTNNCPALSAFFAGKLDDIGMWNRALDECEIQALYNAGAQGVSPTPVSFNGLNSSYSPDDEPATLVGSPSGGTFIGPGVTGNTFDPASAGVGTHSITYTWFDACGGFNTTGLCTTVDQGVGIGGSNMTSGGVLIYPNPNRGQFTVELDLMGLVSLQVFDARGALVHNEVFTSNGSRTQRNLNLSALAKGNYMLQVQNNGGTVTQQVVIQ